VPDIVTKKPSRVGASAAKNARSENSVIGHPRQEWCFARHRAVEVDKALVQWIDLQTGDGERRRRHLQRLIACGVERVDLDQRCLVGGCAVELDVKLAPAASVLTWCTKSVLVPVPAVNVSA
jgi:hypothetical protein